MRVHRISSWPIAIRVALATAALMILLGLVASQQVLATLSRLQDARLREFAQLHVEGLSVALGPFVRNRDIWEVYDTLDRARRDSEAQRILFTVVADDQGRVLAATDPLRAPVDGEMNLFASEALAIEEITATNGSSVVHVASPLSVGGREVGRIVTDIDVSDLLAQRRQATLALLAANAAATMFLALAGYLVVARMLKPVTLLSRHMGEGRDAPRPIPDDKIPRSDGVLSKLLRNFNEMAGAIAARSEAERRLSERERFVSLGRLSSSLAHEINNPLGGLLNATDTIRKFADRPEVVRNSIDLVERGLKHLGDVSRAILDENRLDRSGRPLMREDFDDLRLLFEPEAIRRRQNLGWSVALDACQFFPSSPVRQIALNLLLNASAASPPGGEIELRVAPTPEGLSMAVTDDGPGLSPGDLARLTSADPVQPGGGVGLRLVRDLVFGLGGSIDYRRDEEKSTIRIMLPGGQNP